MNRRAFLGVTLGLAAGGGLVSLRRETMELVLEKRVFPISGLKPSFEGFRIAVLSDFHLHPFTQLPFLKEAMAMARSLRPDLIVLLGDFVDQTVDAIHEISPALSELNARCGVFAILGNHDHNKGFRVVRDGLKKAGVEVLINKGVGLGGGNGELWLAGLDSQTGAPDVARALEGMSPGVPCVMLAHEPDIADAVSVTGKVQLQLSGHSHGGQMNIPGLVNRGLPPWGRRYPFGTYKVGGMALHTTRGLGTTRVPFRYRSIPEVTEVTLVRV